MDAGPVSRRVVLKHCECARQRMGDRVVRSWRWEPSTYLQAWLLAVLTFGVAGIILWLVIGTQVWWPVVAIAFAFAVTINGLTLNWALYGVGESRVDL
jgi:hypothetical protein